MKNEITGPQLEALTGLTARRIQQLAATEKIPVSKAGRWPMVETLKALFRYYRTLREPDKLDEARLQKLLVETKLLELEHAEMDGSLVNFAAALVILRRGHAAVTSTIMAMQDLTIEHREAVVNKIRETMELAVTEFPKETPRNEKTNKNPQAPA